MTPLLRLPPGAPALPTPCPCGETEHHRVASRRTADNLTVELWDSGAITGGMGYGFRGVPVVRPRTREAVESARRAGWLFIGEVELHTEEELPALYAAARKATDREDLYRRLDAAREPAPVRLDWEVTETDHRGAVTARQARLPRLLWPGLVVFHERGRYQLCAERTGFALGSRERTVCEPMGFEFTSLRALFKHLREVQTPAQRAQTQPDATGREVAS